MRRFQLALLAAVAAIACASVASAADMPVKGPVYKAPAAAQVYNWSGWYAGINGGYGWGDDPVSFVPATAAVDFFFTTGAVPNSVGTKPRGGLAGLQLGYNWQWMPHWVAGIEADIDGANINGSGSVTTVTGVVNPIQTSAQQKLTSLGTLRGRLGFAAVDRALFYATGGLAYGRTQLATSIIDVFVPGGLCGPAGTCAAGSSTQWRAGWTVGGGIEWAFASPWSLKLEYLHYDLGTVSVNQNDPVFPGSVFTSSVKFRGDTVRGGINYRFN